MIRRFLTRRFVVTLICLGCTALMYGWFHVGSQEAKRFTEAERFTEDWRARLGRKVPVYPQLVLIGMDRDSYAGDVSEEEIAAEPALGMVRQLYPWPRSVWARVINKLADAGAKVIALDILFKIGTDHDNELAEALHKHRNRVVIASNITGVGKEGDLTRIEWQLDFPSPTLLPVDTMDQAVADERVGFINIWADSDNVVRSARYRIRGEELEGLLDPNAIMESLAARILRQAGRADAIPDGFGPVRVRYTDLSRFGYQKIRLIDVLSPKVWELNYQNGAYFRDKIVMIGPVANVFRDFHPTPLIDKITGPELHLNLVGAALHQAFIKETSSTPILAGFIIGLTGFFAALLCFRVEQPVRRLLYFTAFSVIWLISSQLLYDYANYMLITTYPITLVLLVGVIVLGYDFFLEQIERLKLRTTMGFYFSPKVLEAVLSDPGSTKPRHAEVTALLTDLRNSTPLAEKLGPDGMFNLLNRVFDVQTAAIMEQDGNLEHFLGDQFLSYWGAPQSQPDAADRALRAAQTLIQSMEKLRDSLEAPVKELFGYGVALHCGPVLVGNKGSARRLDYGLVGDTINTAARVESLTKKYGVRFIVTGETLSQLTHPGVKRLLDRVVVEGKTVAVELHELENPTTSANFGQMSAEYEKAFAAYTAGEFESARSQFQALAEKYKDGPSRVLAERCERFLKTPPGNWQGAYRWDSK